MGYSVESLRAGIEKAKVNITTFEEAIEGERNTIKEYRLLIDEIEIAERKEAAKGN